MMRIREDIRLNSVTHHLSLAIITVCCGLAFAIVCSSGLYVVNAADGSGGDLSLTLGLIMGLLISGFMVPSISPTHDIHWDEDFLEGPSKLFGPSLGKIRTKFRWNDIVTNGTVATGYNFVESLSGDRIYYSPYSKGLKPFRTKLASVMPAS